MNHYPIFYGIKRCCAVGLMLSFFIPEAVAQGFTSSHPSSPNRGSSAVGGPSSRSGASVGGPRTAQAGSIGGNDGNATTSSAKAVAAQQSLSGSASLNSAAHAGDTVKKESAAPAAPASVVAMKTRDLTSDSNTAQGASGQNAASSAGAAPNGASSTAAGSSGAAGAGSQSTGNSSSSAGGQ